MKTKTLSYGKILFTILLFLLAGCKATTKIDLLVGREDCSPPCWMGIQPGKTEIDSAVTNLQEHEVAKEGNLAVLDSGIVNWQSIDNYSLNVYHDKDDLVNKMELDV